MVVASLMLIVAAPVSAELFTQDLDSGLTEIDLVNTLLGGGVTISNVTFTGAITAAGTFSGGAGIIGFGSGIVLSSGNIANVIGPNVSDGITGDNELGGDTDLNSLIPGFETYDAAVLEFYFVSVGEEVIFRYVFASDEYNEYVYDSYNDVFGFFLDGVNLALLPDGVTPVSINTVNNGHPDNPTQPPANPQYYINNDLDDGGGSIPTEADGLTVVLEFKAVVIPGELYHIKLAIADAGDSILDSWVFIQAESFAAVEICDDSLDNDGDGLIDNDDPDCQVCGDGDIYPGEDCDDGNNDDGDGCSAECTIEDGGGDVECESDFVIDLFNECATDAENHGEFVSCVADITNVMKQDGSLKGKKKELIQSCATQADILDGDETAKGNNGVGNGKDPQPPGNPPINDGEDTSPGNPGNKGKK
jgi:cysteine-rich repeat protein